MRQSVLRKSSHIRFSLALIMALMFALALSACGGGGGGGGNNNGGGGGGGGGIRVTGKVVSSTNLGVGVAGATVKVNTGQSAKTASDGSFTILNVPSSATTFVVSSPDLSQYTDLGTYNALYYNMDPTASPTCQLPLPSPLRLGANSVGLVGLYPNPSTSSAPPPPPTAYEACGVS